MGPDPTSSGEPLEAARVALFAAASLLLVTAVFARSEAYVEAVDRLVDFHLGGPWVWAWWSVGLVSLVGAFTLHAPESAGRLAAAMGVLWTAAAAIALAVPSVGAGVGDAVVGLVVGAALLVAGIYTKDSAARRAEPVRGPVPP